jgi:thiazole synthase ThiGH ThiG subunit
MGLPAIKINKTARMAQWAYDTLSIPAMSSECERLFSGAKLTITAQRKSLLPNIIEAVEMMNSWYKRGLVRLPGATNDDIGDAMSRYAYRI